MCLYAKTRWNRYVFTSEEAAITTTIVRDVLTGYPSRDTSTRRTFCDHKCLWSPCQTLSFTVVTFFSNAKFFAWYLIKQQATSSPQQTIGAVFRFVEKVVTTAPWWWHGPHDESRSTRKDSTDDTVVLTVVLYFKGFTRAARISSKPFLFILIYLFINGIIVLLTKVQIKNS